MALPIPTRPRLGARAGLALAAAVAAVLIWGSVSPVPARPRAAAASACQAALDTALGLGEGAPGRVVARPVDAGPGAADVAAARAAALQEGAVAVLLHRTVGAGTGTACGDAGWLVLGRPSSGLAAVVFGGPSANLVDAAGGVAAYERGRSADAIARLERARSADPDAPNAGVVAHYLGLAYRLDDQSGAAVAAQEQAVAVYEGRLAAGASLSAEDELILVRAYAERCFLAGLAEDWDGAVAWCAKAADRRDGLLSRADALAPAAELHVAFARVYGRLADAHRARGEAAAERAWSARAADELAAAERAGGDEPYLLVAQAPARLDLGDCVGAVGRLQRALAADPGYVEAHRNLGTVYYFQDRHALAEAQWRQALGLRGDDLSVLENLASLMWERGLGEAYVDLSYLGLAEEYYRQVLAIDPTNVNAHEQLAELAWWRAQAAAVIDGTALQSGDELSVAKSQALWDTDPQRVQTAIDAYGEAIQARRTVATELRPDDPMADAEVAAAYADRVDLLYSGLLAYGLYGAANPSQDADWVAETGERLLDDVAQVREWSAKVLDDPGAGRLAVLSARKALLNATADEWSWYFFDVFGNDPAKAAEAEGRYRQAVTDAVAFVESAPISHRDEIEPAQLIYLEASTYAQLVEGDQAKGEAYMAKSGEVGALGGDLPEAVVPAGTPTVIGYAESTEHLATKCLEAREQTAGDKELAAGDLESAREHFDNALATNPTHVPSLLGLATTLKEADDLPGAVVQAVAATQAEANDPRAWALLAHLQFLSGDDAEASASFDRYLAAVAPLVPQARMASLRGVIGDLRRELDRDPALAPQVAALVPRLATAVDGLTGGAADGFQYPALYADLGALALFADDPALAEPLLRRALELDPHLPIARADLVLAAVAQGRSGTAERDAALREAADPLWQRTDGDGYGPAWVRGAMRQEASAYARRFPDRGHVVDLF